MGYKNEKSRNIDISFLEIDSMIYWIVIKNNNTDNPKNIFTLLNLEIFDGYTEIIQETSNDDLFKKFNKYCQKTNF